MRFFCLFVLSAVIFVKSMSQPEKGDDASLVWGDVVVAAMLHDGLLAGFHCCSILLQIQFHFPLFSLTQLQNKSKRYVNAVVFTFLKG